MNKSLDLIRETIILIKYYSFDIGNYNLKELIIKWTKIYPHDWLPFGVIEAIYQGRLKAVSVEQILNIWLKKGQIYRSFNEEFITLVTPNVGYDLIKEEELKKIFFQQQNIDNKEEFDVIFNTNYRENLQCHQNLCHQGNITEQNSLKFKSTVDNFQPLDDFSQCFQKLKNFVTDHNNGE